MPDFKKAIKEFKKYINDYDLNNGMIKLKVVHTYGVIEASEYISKELNLDHENVELAKIIALLHDIGRFKQAKEYGDYRDYKTLDHGDLAIKILFEDDFIRKFIDTDKYDSVILKAIRNHNKYEIEDGLSDIELLHSKIIKDADKIDNFRVKAINKFENIFNSSKEKLENEIITDKIYNKFLNKKLIVSSERITDMDCWVSYIAFIFDYHFKPSFKYIKDKNYINILVDRINYKNKDTKMKMENIRNIANEYIDDRINN